MSGENVKPGVNVSHPYPDWASFHQAGSNLVSEMFGWINGAAARGIRLDFEAFCNEYAPRIVDHTVRAPGFRDVSEAARDSNREPSDSCVLAADDVSCSRTDAEHRRRYHGGRG